MLKYAKANLRIDTNRIFLTGLSMGGGGTWMYASASVQNAQKFAGIVPICGPCLMSSGANIANGKTPVYAFHALDDREFWAPPSCTIRALDSINKYNPPNRAVATLYPTGGHVIWPKAYDTTYAYQNPSVYEWMLAQNRSVAPNVLPVSRAGVDTIIQATSGNATLNGTSSTDPDGSIIRYFWRKVSGPSGGTITNSNSATASISSMKTPGVYKFELKVVDSRAGWSLDTMQITVNAAPVARAGADLVISLPANSVTLSGTTSSDADGKITKYAWTKVSGPSTFTIVSPSSASTSVTNLVKGTYKFKLTVTDDRNASASDEVAVIVNAPPVAKAGADSTIHLPRNSTILKSGSTDSDGTITSYAWSKIAGPSTFLIDSPALASTRISNLVAGVYSFRLLVKDNRNASSADTVVITVNHPPVARAGSDSTIRLPRNYTTLRGNTSSDVDGTISRYGWSLISGPTTYTIASPTSSVTNVTNMVAGVYSFKLTVTDNRGGVGNDTVNVTITTASAAAFQSGSVMEADNQQEKLEVFPTLVHSLVKLRLRSSYRGRVVYTIINPHGQTVKSVESHKSSPVLELTIPLNELTPGVYYLRTSFNGKDHFTSRIVKQ